MTKRYSVRDRSKSLQLDGSTQHASIAHSVQSGLDVGENDFVFGGWFHTLSSDTVQMMVAKYSGATYASGAGGIGFEMLYRGDLSTKDIYVRVNNGTSTGTTANLEVSTIVPFPRRAGVHVGVYVDRVNEEVYIYFDGVNVTDGGVESISAQPGTFSNTGDFVIGRQTGTASGGHFNGYVAEAFHGPLSTPTTDRDQLMEDIARVGVYPAGVSVWLFDDSAVDVAGENDLTLTGSPSYSTERKFGARTVI